MWMACGAHMTEPDLETYRPLKAHEFSKIRQLAYETFGLDLRAGKETLVSTRLGKHMRQTGYRSFGEYYQHVVEDSTGEALIRLIDALTTNHTSFFREPAHFNFVRNVFLPEWGKRGRIDIWSAACSTGEEPYSLAMCILDHLGSAAFSSVRILATDISTRVLAIAAKGIYPAERLDGVTAAQLHNYWLRGERDWAGHYRATKEVRALIEFRRVNLLDPAFQARHFPLILCRNVMIYFDKPTQQRVVERLAACLEPGGYLLTGHAESLTGIRHGLSYIQPAVYCKAGPEDLPKGKR
jgi:chemotaxis protein methyltransferase CheR